MKATGIVRRIDDLGRVVIPKGLRRTLHIEEGDPLEIFTDDEGGVTFKKYVADTDRINAITRGVLETAKMIDRPVLVAKADGSVYACAGFSESGIPVQDVDLAGGRLAAGFHAAQPGHAYFPAPGHPAVAIRLGTDVSLFTLATSRIPLYSGNPETDSVDVVFCGGKYTESLSDSDRKMFTLAVVLLSSPETKL